MNKKLRKPEFVSLLTNTACYCIFTTRKNYSVSSETGHLCYQWCFDRFNFVNVFLHHPLYSSEKGFLGLFIFEQCCLYTKTQRRTLSPAFLRFFVAKGLGESMHYGTGTQYFNTFLHSFCLYQSWLRHPSILCSSH